MEKIGLGGKLIVFEGIDFTGKSTQVELLANRCKQNGMSVTTTREPGGTPLGEKVREIILARENSELLPLSELMLFIACRAQLYKYVIAPALAKEQVVLSSRYRLSSLAYQGYGRGIALDVIRKLNGLATNKRHPDTTFLIDLPAQYALERKSAEHDRIEKEDLGFYRRVRNGYLELTRGQKDVCRLDGMQAVEGIAEEVADYLGM